MSTLSTATDPPVDMVALAAEIVPRLREHFPVKTEKTRQILTLAEQAGDLVGAYSRWAGLAVSTGEREDVEAELADVAITTYVTAHVLGIELANPGATGLKPLDKTWAIASVYVAVGELVGGDLLQDPALGQALRRVVLRTQRAARALDIDLDAAVRDKAEQLFTRGWRDTEEDL